MEDEQRQHQAWEQNAWGPPAPALGRRPTQQGPEKDTMAEIGEQFTKIAESESTHLYPLLRLNSSFSWKADLWKPIQQSKGQDGRDGPAEAAERRRSQRIRITATVGLCAGQ